MEIDIDSELDFAIQWLENYSIEDNKIEEDKNENF